MLNARLEDHKQQFFYNGNCFGETLEQVQQQQQYFNDIWQTHMRHNVKWKHLNIKNAHRRNKSMEKNKNSVNKCNRLGYVEKWQNMANTYQTVQTVVANC